MAASKGKTTPKRTERTSSIKAWSGQQYRSLQQLQLAVLNCIDHGTLGQAQLQTMFGIINRQLQGPTGQMAPAAPANIAQFRAVA